MAERSHETETVMVTAFFVLLGIMGIAYLYQTSAAMQKIATIVPNASMNIMFGFAIGGLLSLSDTLEESLRFNDDFFFLTFLPLIIFASGFNLRKDFFIYNFGSVVLMAFIGTALATAVIGGILIWLSKETYELTTNESLIFASLISAIDPVATIVTMQSIGVGGKLYALIFGEAVLNDAVAIVINQVFVRVAEKDEDLGESMAIAIPVILGISVASILIGCAFALFAAFLFKKSNLKENHVLECGCFFVLSFLPYLISELLSLSGIMTILFCGIFFDYYAYYHLSDESKITVKSMVHMLEFISESFIFFFLGTAVWDPEIVWRLDLAFLTLCACLIARAASVFPLAFLANLVRKRPITMKEQVMMWFSGLRGPVAFALAYRIGPEAIPNDNDRAAIISCTLIIIWATTFLQGGAAAMMLKCLDLVQIRGVTDRHGNEHDGQALKDFSKSNHWFIRADRTYLSKWFGCTNRDYVERHGIHINQNPEEVYNRVHSNSVIPGGPARASSRLGMERLGSPSAIALGPINTGRNKDSGPNVTYALSGDGKDVRTTTVNVDSGPEPIEAKTAALDKPPLRPQESGEADERVITKISAPPKAKGVQ